mgnify:FL=1
MNTTTYALPKNSKAWYNVLSQSADLLPSGVNCHDVDALAHLPIFAVVVVVNNKALDQNVAQADRPKLITSIMQDYIKTLPKWRLQIVYDDDSAKAQADHIVAGSALADVSMARYLILPADDTQMSPAKRDAAARMIDDQLTSFLRKRLEPDHGENDHVDVHILNVSKVLREHKLVCFDMDSTLIEQEVIVELAKMCGIEDKVSEITERAMRGEIEFAQSFAERVALLEGVPDSVVDDIIKKHITFQTGAYAVIRALKAKGCTTVLVSGGFEPFARHVAQMLGMDEYYANPLLVADGKLTGYTSEPILDGRQKAVIVGKVAERLGVPMTDVVCVGDGANDLPMMAISGLGVAFKAKPIVQVKADVAVNITGLEGVLYALGHRFDKV